MSLLINHSRNRQRLDAIAINADPLLDVENSRVQGGKQKKKRGLRLKNSSIHDHATGDAENSVKANKSGKTRVRRTPLGPRTALGNITNQQNQKGGSNGGLGGLKKQKPLVLTVTRNKTADAKAKANDDAKWEPEHVYGSFGNLPFDGGLDFTGMHDILKAVHNLPGLHEAEPTEMLIEDVEMDSLHTLEELDGLDDLLDLDL
jgi:hypothetical protein